MQIAVITGPNLDTAIPRIRLANSVADGIELRLDLFHKFNFQDLQKMRDLCRGKMILTLRRKDHGGSFQGSEEEKNSLLKELMGVKPDYVDLDFGSKEIIDHNKVILSHHQFERTPKNLDEIFDEMLKIPAYAYKICTTANSMSDSYRMLRLIQKQSKMGVKIIGLCMGDQGRITREEGIKSGNYLNYIVLHHRDKCAPGLQFA